MEKRNLFKEVLECMVIFIITIFLGFCVALVCTTNGGGGVSKYLSYSSKVILQEESNNLFKTNDLIITKEKEVYEKGDYIWYFTSEKDSEISKILEINSEGKNNSYVVNQKEEVSSINIIGKLEYKYSSIGKYIIFFKSIPIVVYALVVLVILGVIILPRNSRKIDDCSEVNK